MIDVGDGAGVLEGMGPEHFLAFDHLPDLDWAPAFSPWIGEVGAVVGQHDMDPVGHGLDQGMQEVRGDTGRGFFMQLGKGELGGPVDRNEEVKPAFGGPYLSDVDVEVADGIGFELALARLVAFEDRGSPGRSAAT